MTSDVIAGQEMLDSCKERLLFLVEDVDHCSIAAGILKAPIRVEIHMTYGISHSKT